MQAIRAASLLIAGAGLVLSSSFSWSQTTAVGFTGGINKVSDNGSFTYAIPIQVPPGRGGLEPKLALVYDSGAGNGPVGVGWQLQGFTTINRCGRTIAQDGQKQNVRYDASDRLCYGGRLVAISGAYGTGDPTEYRTERESFTKIISNGNLGGGPSSLQVQPKAGLWMSFGGSGNSQIQAQGKSPTARAWAVNRVEDDSGNYMTFEYSEDYTNGEHRPIRINYTGNTVTAALPFAKVELTWETRPDVIRKNVAGSDIRISQRLKNIKTYVDNKLVKDYRLVYEVGSTTGNSRLISVTECNGDGTQCFVPSKFTYANYSGVSSQSASAGQLPAAAGWRLTDLFGEGRQLYYTHDGAGNHKASRMTPFGGFNTYAWSTALGNGNAGWDVVDLFGDGKQMYYTHSTDGTHWATRLNNGTGFTNFTWTGGHGVGNAGWSFADLFGDGRKLYYTYSTGGTHNATRLNSNQTVTNFTWTGAGPANADWKSGDPFGDGRQFIVYYSGTTVTALRLSEGQTAPEAWTWNVTGLAVGTEGWRMADIFGDGRDVFYTNSGNGTHFAVRLNSDGTFNTFSWTGTPVKSNGGWDLADLKGDGRMSYVTHTTTGLHTVVQLNPTSPATFTTWSWSDTIAEADGGWKMGDVFGTGRSLYFTQANNGTHYMSAPYPYLLNTAPADYMISASVGVGQASVTVDYGRIIDSAMYHRENNAVYPVRDLQVPLHVVRQMIQTDGNGNSQQTTYFYDGAKSHVAGGGFLGFRRVDATNVTNGIKTSTTSRVDYPFHGQPASIVRVTATGAELSDVTNTYTDTTIPNTTGNYHKSLVTQSVTTTNDLNGTALPTFTTTTTYDSFGNALTVNVSTTDGFTKAVTNVYDNFTSGGKWILGRVKRSTIASTKPSPVQTLTRRSAAEYSSTTGLLLREIIEPDDSNLCLVTTYTYDSYGNRASAFTRNCNGTSSGGVTEAPAPTGNAVFTARTTGTTQHQAGSVTIDGTVYNYPAGQFPTSSTNALSQTETRTFDPRFGGPLSHTGPNSLTTTWTYDKFGRKATEVRADGTTVTTTYAFCGSAPNYCGHSVTVATTGAPTTTAHYDRLNRITRKEVQGFSGTLVRTDTQYDALGRVWRTSQPYFAGGSPTWSTYMYDLLDRPTTVINPTGGVTTRTYNGLVSSVINPLGQTETQTRNSQGQVTRMVRQ